MTTSRQSSGKRPVALNIEVSERLLERFGGPGEKFNALVEALLTAIDRGGEIIPPDTMRDAKRMWPEFRPESIPDLIRKALEVTESEAEIRVRIDPFYLTALKEIADRQGVDLKTMVQASVNYALDAGWLYESLPQPVVIRLEPTELNRLAELLGVDPRMIDGRLIVEVIEKVCQFTKQSA